MLQLTERKIKKHKQFNYIVKFIYLPKTLKLSEEDERWREPTVAAGSANFFRSPNMSRTMNTFGC